MSRKRQEKPGEEALLTKEFPVMKVALMIYIPVIQSEEKMLKNGKIVDLSSIFCHLTKKWKHELTLRALYNVIPKQQLHYKQTKGWSKKQTYSTTTLLTTLILFIHYSWLLLHHQTQILPHLKHHRLALVENVATIPSRIALSLFHIRLNFFTCSVNWSFNPTLYPCEEELHCFYVLLMSERFILVFSFFSLLFQFEFGPLFLLSWRKCYHLFAGGNTYFLLTSAQYPLLNSQCSSCLDYSYLIYSNPLFFLCPSFALSSC